METYLTKAQRLVLQAAIRWLEKHDDPKIDQITKLAEIDYGLYPAFLNGMRPRVGFLNAPILPVSRLPVEEFLAERAKVNPTGRVGDPFEFGEACAFLCAASSGFIVGQNLLLDGGAFNSTMG